MILRNTYNKRKQFICTQEIYKESKRAKKI